VIVEFTKKKKNLFKFLYLSISRHIRCDEFKAIFFPTEKLNIFVRGAKFCDSEKFVYR